MKDTIGTIILVVVLCAAMLIAIWFLIVFFRARKETKRDRRRRSNNQVDMDSGTELMLGVMGSEILHHHRDKLKQENKERESLYWQEAIRNKNE
jgi:hypothetical protein